MALNQQRYQKVIMSARRSQEPVGVGLSEQLKQHHDQRRQQANELLRKASMQNHQEHYRQGVSRDEFKVKTTQEDIKAIIKTNLHDLQQRALEKWTQDKKQEISQKYLHETQVMQRAALKGAADERIREEVQLNKDRLIRGALSGRNLELLMKGGL